MTDSIANYAPEGFSEVWELFDAVSAVTIFEGSESDVKALFDTYYSRLDGEGWKLGITLDYDRKATTFNAVTGTHTKD